MDLKLENENKLGLLIISSTCESTLSNVKYRVKVDVIPNKELKILRSTHIVLQWMSEA